MKRNRNKKGVGKVVTGVLIGSVVGAAVGWLTAPTSGVETRRKLSGARDNLQEKIKTSEGNVESQARAVAAEVKEKAGEETTAVNRRRVSF